MSTKLKGMLTAEQLREHAESGEIEQVIVGFTDIYGKLCGKIVDVNFFLEAPASACCNYLFAVDMEMNPVRGYQYANWEKGFGDIVCDPDFATLRRATWLDKTAIILGDVVEESSHKLVPIAPRSILKRQIERLKEAGFMAYAASELEFYSYEQNYKEAKKMGYRGLEPRSYYVEDYQLLAMTREEPYVGACRKHLTNSGIPVENSKGEAGLGQHELNVRYTDILNMADRHVVYKQCLKEVAGQHNISVTFMAKPHADQSGSSCHIHISLWDAAGRENLFAGDEDHCGIKCSPLFVHFLAGIVAHIEDFMVFYAPTVNSYKRFTDGSWAPTRIAWCRDNRTAGVRVVGHGKSLRIECRIPGADANIYLAFAAVLASGLDGVQNKLEPPAMFEGNIYAAEEVQRVPASLSHAITLFENSEFARKVLGDDVIYHYVHFFKQEQRAYELAVTDWELHRYFERI
eukprot:Colp12_sorted_trinity150504_noHs@3054